MLGFQDIRRRRRAIDFGLGVGYVMFGRAVELGGHACLFLFSYIHME